MKGFEILSNEVKTNLNEIVTSVVNFFDGENVDNVEEFDLVEAMVSKGYDDEGDGKFDIMIDYVEESIKELAYRSKFKTRYKDAEVYTMGKTYHYTEADGYPADDEVSVDMYDCLSFEDGVVRAAYED